MPRAKAQPKQRPITTWKDVPVIMDTAYVAMLLGLTINEVRAMAVRGDLPAIKPGKRAWRFEKTALMKALGVNGNS